MIALLLIALFAPGAPTCDATILTKVETALKKAPPEQRHLLALVGTAEACQLSNGLKKGVEAMRSAPAEHRMMRVSKAISESIPQWTAACPAGIEVFQRLVTMAPATRVLHAFKQCKVKRFGVKLADLGKPAQLSLLGLMVAHHVRAFNPKASPALITALLREQ